MGRWAGRTRVDAHFWAGRVAIIIFLKKEKGLKYLFLSAAATTVFKKRARGRSYNRGHYAHPSPPPLFGPSPALHCILHYHLSNTSLIWHPVPNPATPPLASISTTAVSSAPPPCIHLQALGGVAMCVFFPRCSS